MAAVEISNLRKLYGDFVALSDINISINSGTFYTLLGPSGCGKTTLLRTVAGFHYQDSGAIKIGDRQVEHTPAHKRGVGMVFQDYAVFPHLSVADNVAFGLKQQGLSAAAAKPRVIEALKIVQLEELAERMPHELSGGQQQRVGLARAIVINPTVLLMDEPLSNLDAKLRVDLRAELRRIQKTMNMTTLYVTHDQEEALAMSDVVCVMYGGVIQQAASPFEIYKKPSNKFVANFVGGNNFLKASGTNNSIHLAAAEQTFEKQIDSAHRGNLSVSIRPEDFQVSTEAFSKTEGKIIVSASLVEVSFIGKEMEIHAVAKTGETVKAVAKPDNKIMSLEAGANVHFAAQISDIEIYEDEELGRRVS